MKKTLSFLLISFLLLSLIIIPLPAKIFANDSSCTLDVTPEMAGFETTFDMSFTNCQTYVYNLDYGADTVVGVINNASENRTNKHNFTFSGQYTAVLRVFIDASGSPGLYRPAEDTLICQTTVTFTVAENTDAGMNITPGYNTIIELFNEILDVDGYGFILIKFCGSFEELESLSEEEIEDRIIIGDDFPGDPDGVVHNISLSDGGYFAIFFVDSPNVKPGYIEFFTVGTGCEGKKDEITEQVWIRNVDMTCYQVWVNDDGCFEFVFWWEYKNNNWVKIYDNVGNEVFSIDMPYGKATFEACLADGTYTVKTYHDQPEQLQEFVIAK